MIRVRYERPILPRSITGETVRLVSGARRIGVIVRADPALPGIEITPRSAMDSEVSWRVVIEGLRDLDGALVVAHELRFRTSTIETIAPRPPAPDFETLIGPLLASRCGGCHGGAAPILGLDLSSAAGLRATAIGIAARETPPAPSAGAVEAGGLGGMPRIAIGSPETSYLVYKLLGDPHIVGDRMPPPGDGGAAALAADEIAAITAWIRGGALVPE